MKLHSTDMKKQLTCFLFSWFFIVPLTAQWQWSVPLDNYVSGETNAPPTAFLWVPDSCTRINAVVVGMHNMQEEGILEHPEFREVMSRLGVAQIWITPGLDPLFAENDGSHRVFERMLTDLAEVSGYSEIASAPVVPIGHSAYASYPWNFGAWYPERTLAMLSIHGDAPQTHLTGCGRPNPDWGDRTIEGIPGLIVMGEYEWWEDRLQSAFRYRRDHPRVPLSVLADAGHGHFDHSNELVRYLAVFIEKALRARLPEPRLSGESPQLLPVGAGEGWLADRWHPDQRPPDAPAAPSGLYTADPSEAFWYFDGEMAALTEAYYERARGKKEQYIGFEQQGKLLEYDPGRHGGFSPRFHPREDGLTFSIRPLFTDSLRRCITAEHAGGEALRIDRLNGPVEKLDDTTFTVRFYRMGLDNPKRTGDIWLIASQPGDGQYKSAVQSLNIRIPHRNTEGMEQRITFPEIPDVAEGQTELELHAVSNSGLPVYYYVKEGPAVIDGNRVVFTPVPPRAKYPVKVTVVAWQYGRTADPQIQTAPSVERSFYIRRR